MNPLRRPLCIFALAVALAATLAAPGAAEECNETPEYTCPCHDVRGTLFTPQEGSTVTGRLHIEGYWDSPGVALEVRVDNADGTSALFGYTYSSTTPTTFNCGSAGSCPITRAGYRYYVESATEGPYEEGWKTLWIRKWGNKCRFAKPINFGCFAGSNYCVAQNGGINAGCGTGFRNVLFYWR